MSEYYAHTAELPDPKQTTISERVRRLETSNCHHEGGDFLA